VNRKDFENVSQAINNIRVNIAYTDGSTFLRRNVITPLERLALRLKLKEMFNVFEDSTLDQMEKEYFAVKTKIEKEKALKEQKERELWLKERNDPFNRFCWILRNNLHLVTPQELDCWLNETTIEQRREVYKKFKRLASARGLSLPRTTIEFGMSLLQGSLKAENKEENKKCKKKKLLRLFRKA